MGEPPSPNAIPPDHHKRRLAFPRLRGAAIHSDCPFSLPSLKAFGEHEIEVAMHLCGIHWPIRRQSTPHPRHHRLRSCRKQHSKRATSSQRLPRFEPPTIPGSVTSEGRRWQTKCQYSAFFWAASGRSDVRVSLLHPCASRPVPRGCLQGLLAVNNEPLRSQGGVPCPAAFKPPPVTTAWETTGAFAEASTCSRNGTTARHQTGGQPMPRPSTSLPEPAPSEYCPVKVRSISFSR